MDFLTFDVTRKILETVNKNNGQFTSHNIAVRMDRQDDIPPIPPPLYVLEKLKEHGYLELDPPGNYSNSKYKLTEKGRLLLSSFI